ncbi:SPFH domain-containing protein [Candidatus Latescibacterota bacterium]
MVTEKMQPQYSGWTVLIILFVVFTGSLFILGFSIYLASRGHHPSTGPYVVLGILSCLISGFMFSSFFTVEPNQAVVLLLFGKYMGTEKVTGFRWTNPLYTRRKLSLRARNFDGDRLKVNDKIGNPIEISAVVVWRVSDTAKASFEVDDYVKYIHIQTESAIRHLATSYPYDTLDGEETSLRSSIDEVSEALSAEIQERTESAGVEILEARINHLSYATEIAQAMLRRQQAEAIIAARQKIVDGSVGMVELALQRLEKEGVVELDEERKANMVSNLMMVLCSEEATQPIINVGSLY